MTGSQGTISQAEDFLKQAWQQYGKNGFVNQTELGQVCESIGMEKLSTDVSHFQPFSINAILSLCYCYGFQNHVCSLTHETLIYLP